MSKRTCWVLVGLLGFAGLGCSETVSSADIKTHGIAALIDVTADASAVATVHVELRVGGPSSNTFVTLDNGDTLSATAGDVTKPLQSIDRGVYEAKFSGVEADTPFSVAFKRPNDTSAVDNSGALPAPFDLDKPAADKSRADDDLPVTWSPSGTGDGMHLAIDGSCIFSSSKDVSDTGSYTIPKGSLSSLDDKKPETCDLALDVERSRSGHVDIAFDSDSWFRLHQARSTKFTSAP